MTVAHQKSGAYCEIGAPYKALLLLNQGNLGHGPWHFEGQYYGPLIVYNHFQAQIHT